MIYTIKGTPKVGPKVRGLYASEQIFKNAVFVANSGARRGLVHLSNGFRQLCGNKVSRSCVKLTSTDAKQTEQLINERGLCSRCFSSVTSSDVHLHSVMTDISKLNLCNYPVVFSLVHTALSEESPHFLHWSSNDGAVYDGMKLTQREQDETARKINAQTKSICKSLMSRNEKHRRVGVPVPERSDTSVTKGIVLDDSEQSINQVTTLFSFSDYATSETKVRVLKENGIVLFLSSGSLYYAIGGYRDSQTLTLDLYA